MNYHTYIDKSKRKPYICGVCNLDILHPIHQPQLAGMEYVPEDRMGDLFEEIEEVPVPLVEDQLALF